jgi:hypothetical protein
MRYVLRFVLSFVAYTCLLLVAHPARAEMPVIAPLLALALVLDAVAQATGFAFGAGRSAVNAGLYDLDREPHLDAADRARFMP